MNRTLEIPLDNTDEVVVISMDDLPKPEEVVSLLECEKSKLHLWNTISLEYYKKGDSDTFVKLLELSRNKANIQYKNSKVDQMKALDMLGAYYVQTANREETMDKRKQLFLKASLVYAAGDKIMMYDTDHLLGRAFFCLLEGGKIDEAENQLNFVLSKSLNNIPALLGKACIAFRRKDYNEALAYYKKVLRSIPNCPTDIRLGLAHCFWKLGYEEKAQLAFERELELNPMCVGALIGLAILNLNGQKREDIKLGVNMLSRAYNIDDKNSMALNHLSNHFFFKKDYTKSEALARRAFQYADSDAVRAESCYQIARISHIESKFEQAFQYYFQASKLGPTEFILPLYGLGQMYIHIGNVENAIHCFEKILKLQPESYESMEILGSLYVATDDKRKLDIAKTYFKKVTEYCPNNISVLVDLAHILERSDVEESLFAYDKAIDLMHKNNLHNLISPEILNNIAALNYRMGNIDKSRCVLEEALSLSKKMIEFNPQRYSSVAVTTAYNLGRIYEVQCQFQIAEKNYKDILKEHPNYIDCYLRLGCMARDRNQIYDASDWFKEALSIDNTNTNAWLLLGNLHMQKSEWGPAQKKFERVLKNPSTLHDPYALIAMGNIWLQTLYQPSTNEDQEKRHQELALEFFIKVMKIDPKNIWAVNGIGCVMAYKRYINEAKEIFEQVREATSDFCDVWLNLAHIYIMQQDYLKAIQIYENCRKKFFKYDDVKILQYLAVAYFKAGLLEKAKDLILKARMVAPQDKMILHNISVVLQKLSAQILGNDKSNIKSILHAVNELKLSKKCFQYLAKHENRMKNNISMASFEAEQCQILLLQSKYIVIRAQKLYNDEYDKRLKQEMERQTLLMKQIEDETETIKQKEIIKNQLLHKRLEYKEKTKDTILLFQRKTRQRKKKLCKQNESGQDGSTSKKNGGTDNKKAEFEHKHTYKKEKLSSKRKCKIVPKATISSSEDDMSRSDNEVKKEACEQMESRSNTKLNDTSGSNLTSFPRSESNFSSENLSSLNQRSEKQSVTK